MILDQTLFQHLLEATPDAVLLVAEDGKILHANQAAQHVFGFAPADLIGQPIEALVPAPSRREHPALRASFHASGGHRRMGSGVVVHGLHADGSTIPLDIQLAPLEYEDQRITVAVARNIAHILRLQDELANYAVQLEESLADSEARRARLEVLDAEKNKLLGITAHDLRNPLTALRVFTDLLEGGALGAVSDSHLPLITRISKSVDYMSNLVDQILDWSAIEAGHLTLRPEPTDMADLMTTSLAVERLAASPHGVEIRSELDDGVGTVLIDPNKFEQVVHNLVSNAVRFSPDPGVVDVVLQRAGDTMTLRVVDRGPGVPAAERTTIFAPYTRGETHTPKGVGLGLAIVAQIVAAHDGTALIEDTPGGGATFLVSLPLR